MQKQSSSLSATVKPCLEIIANSHSCNWETSVLSVILLLLGFSFYFIKPFCSIFSSLDSVHYSNFVECLKSLIGYDHIKPDYFISSRPRMYCYLCSGCLVPPIIKENPKSFCFHSSEHALWIRGKAFFLAKLSLVPRNFIPFQQKHKLSKRNRKPCLCCQKNISNTPS